MSSASQEKQKPPRSSRMDKLARVCTACVLIPLAAVALGFLCDLIEFAPSRTPFGFGGTQLIRLFIIQDEDGFSFCRDCDGPHAGLISFHYGTTYERLRPLLSCRVICAAFTPRIPWKTNGMKRGRRHLGLRL